MKLYCARLEQCGDLSAGKLYTSMDECLAVGMEETVGWLDSAEPAQCGATYAPCEAANCLEVLRVAPAPCTRPFLSACLPGDWYADACEPWTQ